jgi:hypothetical protein
MFDGNMGLGEVGVESLDFSYHEKVVSVCRPSQQDEFSGMSSQTNSGKVFTSTHSRLLHFDTYIYRSRKRLSGV